MTAKRQLRREHASMVINQATVAVPERHSNKTDALLAKALDILAITLGLFILATGFVGHSSCTKGTFVELALGGVRRRAEYIY